MSLDPQDLFNSLVHLWTVLALWVWTKITLLSSESKQFVNLILQQSSWTLDYFAYQPTPTFTPAQKPPIPLTRIGDRDTARPQLRTPDSRAGQRPCRMVVW